MTIVFEWSWCRGLIRFGGRADYASTSHNGTRRGMIVRSAALVEQGVTHCASHDGTRRGMVVRRAEDVQQGTRALRMMEPGVV